MVDRHHPGKAPTAVLQELADGSCKTIDALEAALDLTRRQVSDAAACLLRRDYLMRSGAGCYQLTEAGVAAAASGEVIRSGPRGPSGAIPVHRDTLRERAWRAMRVARHFTLDDIVADAARADEAGARENTRKYIGRLAEAGFVRELPRRQSGTALTSNGFKRFILSRNTGPKAPVYRAALKAIHDFNTGEDVPCAPR